MPARSLWARLSCARGEYMISQRYFRVCGRGDECWAWHNIGDAKPRLPRTESRGNVSNILYARVLTAIMKTMKCAFLEIINERAKSLSKA